MSEQMSKRKDHAFGKDVYLLGRNKYGELLWLEAPSWDCGWYWGFGYVEVYTGRAAKDENASPGQSRDISSHSHFEGLVGFKTEKNDYVHHLNESPEMQVTVLSESESWELCDLMKSFYTLKDAAAIFHSGNSHLASTRGADLKNSDMENHINQIAIPAITARVLEILSPAKSQDIAA